VIYDTLIEQSEPVEVVAVLAHELGHWANWDTTRQLLIAEVHSQLTLLSIGISFHVFPHVFHIHREWKHVPFVRIRFRYACVGWLIVVQ
jgi:Zn-dependent protease with chaperone function